MKRKCELPALRPQPTTGEKRKRVNMRSEVEMEEGETPSRSLGRKMRWGEGRGSTYCCVGPAAAASWMDGWGREVRLLKYWTSYIQTYIFTHKYIYYILVHTSIHIYSSTHIYMNTYSYVRSSLFINSYLHITACCLYLCMHPTWTEVFLMCK